MSSATIAMAIANANQASGTIVELDPEEFQRVLHKARDLVVVVSPPRRFHSRYDYLTSYRGLAFHTTSKTALPLPSGSEVISAKKISIPTL